ncbi:MAG: hypothetical protein M3186_14780 [Actinomycetota bacterium]|nr:hypothetical protein [Actinomycetota bacterium]
MVAVELNRLDDHQSNRQLLFRAVTVIMGMVVGLTFLFGFGIVLNLALRPGVPVLSRRWSLLRWISRSSGSCSGARHLALAGASVDLLPSSRPTADLHQRGHSCANVADPLVAGEYGTAAFVAAFALDQLWWLYVETWKIRLPLMRLRRSAVMRRLGPGAGFGNRTGSRCSAPPQNGIDQSGDEPS